jgi:predicted GNAT family N-acyltransferase
VTAAPLDVRAVDGPAGLALTAPLRRAVFIDEQQVPEDLEWDEHDAYARHYVACRGPYVVVAVARTIRPGPATVKVQRVAVRRDLRGAGVGAALMGRIVDDARRDGTRHVVLDAQISAVGFYRRLGFAVRTAPFLDAGIPHVHMTATTGATP